MTTNPMPPMIIIKEVEILKRISSENWTNEVLPNKSNPALLKEEIA